MSAKAENKNEFVTQNEPLSAVNEEVDSLVRSITHAFRSPVWTMTGFTDIIIEECADKMDDKCREDASCLKKSAEHLSFLIQEVESLASICRHDIHRTHVDLSALASSITEGLRKQDESRNVETDIASNVFTQGDKQLLTVALTHIFDNAWKYTMNRNPARIEFNVCGTPGHGSRSEQITFFIRDNGAGFEAVSASRLFKPFSRLHAEKEFGGNGMGLCIARRIVHMHGGYIWAEGKEGVGATFYISLPAK